MLNGQRIAVVRCEGIFIFGNFYLNKVKYLEFLRKRSITNPKKDPFHHGAPSKILYRTIRGMLPHKLRRDAEALKMLRVYEGVPPTYDRQKRWVVLSCINYVAIYVHLTKKYAIKIDQKLHAVFSTIPNMQRGPRSLEFDTYGLERRFSTYGPWPSSGPWSINQNESNMYNIYV